MRIFLLAGFLLTFSYTGPARAESPLLIFRCSIGEHMPVRTVEIYKWAGRHLILELLEDGWHSEYMPESQWIAKKIQLHPDNGSRGLAYLDGSQWIFEFQYENGYTRGTMDCFSL